MPEATSSAAVAAKSQPHAEYQRRFEARQRLAADLLRRDHLLGNSRLGVFLCGVGLAFGAYLQRDLISPAWLLVPAFGFVALLLVHDRVIRQRQAAQRAARFYELGLARMEDRWAGTGPTGERFRPAGHPYAEDLDLFGKGGLWELLCTARTFLGQQILAGWLLAPSEATAARARQEAVADLRDRLELREDLVQFSEQTEVNVDAVRAWGATPPQEIAPAWRILAGALAVVVFWQLFAWLQGGSFWYFAGTIAVTQLLMSPVTGRAAASMHSVEPLGRDFFLFSRLIQRLETERFTAPLLRELAGRIHVGNGPASGQPGGSGAASARLARLNSLIAYVQSLHNGVFAILGALLMLPVHLAAGLETWRRENGAFVAVWIQTAAEIEALTSLSCYAYEHPQDPFPEITEGEPHFEAEGLGHPLLPASTAVRNDVAIGRELRLLVVSGSNMSGKSTLLRSIGINTALALAGAPVRAQQLRLSPLRAGTSLRISDSLQSGTSHFYAEIQRLREIVDLTNGSLPVLFLLDEILHGTNSHDRRIGAEAVVRTMVRKGALGLVTTHDLALAKLVEDTELHAKNVHFEDHLQDGKVSFDYRLREGVVTKSNALELMRAVGLEV